MPSIIVPSDFSKNSTIALRYAIQLCKISKLDLIVFHASHISAYALSAASTEEQMTLLLQEDETSKMEKLQDQVNKAYKYLNIAKIPAGTRLLVQYSPMVVERTLELATEQKASMIIMGTHGATGINKFFFGSNTSVMISKSDIPVLAIPENYKWNAPKDILFASDLENIGKELKQLLPLAVSTKANIRVLYLDYGIDADDKKMKKALEAIKASGYKKIKIEIQKASIEDTLVSQVKKYIAKNKPDILVMFTRERTMWDRLFGKGSKTEDMSTSLSTPLLTYKKR
jgi:nucleotide-binding universal stress UspA family protein